MEDWRQTLRFISLLALLGGLVWLVIGAAPLLESLLIAALLAYVLNPLVRFLERRARLRRPLAAGTVYALFLVILAGIPAWLGSVAYARFSRMGADLQAAGRELDRLLAQPIQLLGFRLEPEALVDYVQRALATAIAELPGGSLDVVGNVTANLIWAMVVLVSTYYLLKDGPQIRPWLVSQMPPELREEIDMLLREIDRAWSVFLKAQLIIFVVLAVLFALGTLLVIWLFRAGLLPFSPLLVVILLAVVYSLVQQVDNLWLRPQLMGRRLYLHPGLVFVGLMAALALSGVLGAIVVVPLMATAKIIGGYLHRKLLGMPPWPQAEARSDAQEARGGSQEAPGDRKVDGA
jgi:predicted PurR-regulated permease PerM